MRRRWECEGHGGAHRLRPHRRDQQQDLRIHADFGTVWSCKAQPAGVRRRPAPGPLLANTPPSHHMIDESIQLPLFLYITRFVFFPPRPKSGGDIARENRGMWTNIQRLAHKHLGEKQCNITSCLTHETPSESVDDPTPNITLNATAGSSIDASGMRLRRMSTEPPRAIGLGVTVNAKM